MGIATISVTEKPAGRPLASLRSVVADSASLSFVAIVDWIEGAAWDVVAIETEMSTEPAVTCDRCGWGVSRARRVWKRCDEV